MDAGECLPITWHGARNHDDARLTARVIARECLLNQWPLDSAILLGELSLFAHFRKVTTSTQGVEVEHQSVLGLCRIVQFVDRGWRGKFVRRAARHGRLGARLLVPEPGNGLFD